MSELATWAAVAFSAVGGLVGFAAAFAVSMHRISAMEKSLDSLTRLVDTARERDSKQDERLAVIEYKLHTLASQDAHAH